MDNACNILAFFFQVYSVEDVAPCKSAKEVMDAHNKKAQDHEIIRIKLTTNNALVFASGFGSVAGDTIVHSTGDTAC